MKQLVRTLIAGGAALAVSAGSAPVATAHPIGEGGTTAFIDPISLLISDACGFQVIGTITGHFFDLAITGSGTVVQRELDFEAFRETVEAPSTGRSFSFPIARSFHYSYPDGTDPGDRAIVRVTGLVRDLPGLPAEAGTTFYADATVLFTNTDGFPIVDFGEPTTLSGNRIDPATSIAAVCKTLGS
jgi:hypothetical protein